MYQTRQALIDHLEQAKDAQKENGDEYILNESEAQEIKKYAAEFSRGSGQKAVRLSIDLPAIMVAFDTGQPLSHVPDHDMSLIFVVDNKHLDREEGEKDALLFAGQYMIFLRDNQDFEDEDSYYSFVDLENTRLEALLYDQKYTVLGAQVTISVDRHGS